MDENEVVNGSSSDDLMQRILEELQGLRTDLQKYHDADAAQRTENAAAAATDSAKMRRSLNDVAKSSEDAARASSGRDATQQESINGISQSVEGLRQDVLTGAGSVKDQVRESGSTAAEASHEIYSAMTGDTSKNVASDYYNKQSSGTAVIVLCFGILFGFLLVKWLLSEFGSPKGDSNDSE